MSLGCDEDCQRCGSLSLFSSRRSYLFDFCLVVRKVRFGTGKFCHNFLSSKRHLHLESVTWESLESWGSFPPVLITWALCFSTREEFSKKICWAALSLSYLPAPTSLSFAHSVCLQIEQILGRFGKVWTMPGGNQAGWLWLLSKGESPITKKSSKERFQFLWKHVAIQPKKSWITIRKTKNCYDWHFAHTNIPPIFDI